ncbi:MAG: hypothetical protein HYZ38_26635 [Mycobacterium sp.]|nr:hypothetical protein [Mycobacterium sp.]
MFNVEIWGTVGEWVGGVGTAASAAAAVVIYSQGQKAEKWTQARLVRGYLYPSPSKFEVSVINDSDRAISLELIFYREKSFRSALLAGESMYTHREVHIATEEDGTPVMSSGPFHDAYLRVSHKGEILGYRNAGGTHNLGYQLGDARRLAAGDTRGFSLDPKMILYHPSREYRLYFLDAMGLPWERELLPAPGMIGKLYKSGYHHSPHSLGTGMRGRMKLIGKFRVRRRALLKVLSQYWWLWVHRKEKTTAHQPASVTPPERIFEVPATDPRLKRRRWWRR